MQSYWQFFCEPEQRGEFTPARTEDPASGDRSGWSCEPSAMDSGTASAGQGDRQSESNSDPLPCRACKKDGEGRGFGGSGFFFSNTIARYYMEDMRHRQKEVMKLLC